MAIVRRFGVIVAVALVVAGTTLARAKEVAFPDGEWTGKAIWIGSISKQDIFATGKGDVSFTMAVDGGEVAAGTLTMNGVGKGKAPGATAKLTVKGSLDLSGTGAVVEVSGSVKWSGSATSAILGITVPIKFSAQAGGSFSPTFATCNKVVGDLATETRKVQQSYGFSTTVKANFVAVRTGASPAAQGLIEDYKSLVQAVLDMLTGGPVDIGLLLDLAHQIDALNAALAGLGGCDVPPKGFEKGLQDTLLASLFQDLLQDQVLPGDSYTAQELLAFLGVGIHVGAVGAAVPGNLGPNAKNLFTQFEAALEVKLNQAIAANDTQTITDILIGAQQYGLDSLADKAQGALATVEGP